MLDESGSGAVESSFGEPVFDVSPAKKLLRHDIKIGKHIDQNFNVLGQSTWYQVFKKSTFKQIVYQQIRRWKFINYLNEKRMEKRKGIPDRSS